MEPAGERAGDGPFAPLIAAVSAVAALEAAAVVASAGAADRPYAARFAGVVALAAIAFAAAVCAGTMGSRRIRSRRPAPAGALSPCVASLSLGIAVSWAVLFALANGIPPLVTRGTLGPGASLALGLGIGCIAGLTRALALRRATSGRILAAATCEPPLAAAVLTGGTIVLWNHRLLPTSLRGALLRLAVAIIVLGACWLVVRLAGSLLARSTALPRAVPVGVAALGAGAALLLVVAGRSPFPLPRPRQAGPPDVILFVLDTARADFVPAPEGSTHPTPALARLASEGRRWTRAFSTSCWTLPAHGSLFTGLAPSGCGAGWATGRLPEGAATIAERFAAAGRRTGAFSANPWIVPELGFGRGFERFVVADTDRRPRRPWLVAFLPWLFARSDAALLFDDKAGLTVVSEALRFLGGQDGRGAFVFINVMEPHLPYLPPRRFLSRLEGSGWDADSLARLDQSRLRDLKPGGERTAREIEGLRLLYAAEVAYCDRLVARLVERLEASKRLEGTILVLTSDHGENLGQHAPLDHQLGLYDTLLRVPLIVRWPPRFAAGTHAEGLVSLADLPGALLELAGVEESLPPARVTAATGPPIASRDGDPRALFDPALRDGVFFEYDRPGHILDLIRRDLGIDPKPWDRSLAGIRTATLKWIEASDGRHEAFDLSSDPGETRNLTGLPPPELAVLAARLRALVPAAGAPSPRPTPPGMPAETEQRLRSLGYLR